VGGGADVNGQLAKQVEISGHERVAGTAGRQSQLAHLLALVRERQSQQVALVLGHIAFRAQPAVTERDRDIRQPERGRHGPHDSGQDASASDGLIEHLSESSQDRPRVIAIAVHEVVDQVLHPLTQRLECDCDEPGGNE